MAGGGDVADDSEGVRVVGCNVCADDEEDHNRGGRIVGQGSGRVDAATDDALEVGTLEVPTGAVSSPDLYCAWSIRG